jgi:hypothetical protein
VRRAWAIASGAVCAGGGAAALLGIAASAVPAATGCTTHQCDMLVTGFDAEPPGSTEELTPGGELVWRSSPPAGPWIDFPGLRTDVITFPYPFVCPPDVNVQLAGDNSDAQAGYISGVGGGAIISGYADADGLYRTITVTNPTCAEFGLFVEARGLPVGTPSPWCLIDGGNVLGNGETTDTGPADAGVPEASE